VVALLLGTTPASASITVGQTPGIADPVCTTGNTDIFNTSVPAATTSYRSPVTGALTSWSTRAAVGNGQTLTMKVFRKVSDPDTYQVVAHDGPRDLAPNTHNTFGGLSIPVKAGDFVGLNSENATSVDNACLFDQPGAVYLFNNTGLADGQSEPFSDAFDDAVNVSAQIQPDNSFRIGAVTRNKKKGTAIVPVNVPNPGELSAAGKGVKSASVARSSKVVGVGTASLVIRAKGKQKRKLNENGKVKLAPRITYIPTGGDPTTQRTKLKLKKK
jgi:hypothetical protein